MSDGYVPRAGSTAHKIIEFLKKQPAGAGFTSAELEAKVKVKSASMAMRKPLDAGTVVVEKQGNAFVYSLPAPPQPTDGKLTIGSWSDGDVIVQGGTPNEDGSVTYTRSQILQLLQFVTAPHIGTPVHTELVPTTPLLAGSGAQE
jgi:hypothetical protein